MPISSGQRGSAHSIVFSRRRRPQTWHENSDAAENSGGVFRVAVPGPKCRRTAANFPFAKLGSSSTQIPNPTTLIIHGQCVGPQTAAGPMFVIEVNSL